MTKEEIVQGLYRGDSKAIKEAIKALEQQSNDEDCVSRAELMKLYYESRPTLATNVYEFGEKLQALPTVTPTHCMAEVKFSKEDLREICNERIEIECTHGTCKDCKWWDKDEENCLHLSNSNGWFEDKYYQVHTESGFYCADFEKRGNSDGSN